MQIEAQVGHATKRPTCAFVVIKKSKRIFTFAFSLLYEFICINRHIAR